jgi:hypothetical protein
VGFTDGPCQVGRQRITRERPGGQHHGALLRDGQHLGVHALDQRVGVDAPRHLGAEALTVHGEGTARRHLRLGAHAHDQRACAPHLFLEQPDGVAQVGAAERVAAHQLGQEVDLLRGGALGGLLLQQAHGHAALGQLPSALGAREATAHYRDRATR